MKALVKAVQGPGLELTEVPDPTSGPGDVLLRVLRTGICGTDLHIEAWDKWAANTINAPLVVGHEFAGDLVSGEGHLICGMCRNCRAGPAAPVREHHRSRRAHRRRVRPVRGAAGTECLGAQLPVAVDVAAIFDPFGNAVLGRPAVIATAEAPCWKKCHEFETDLGDIVVRQPRNPQVFQDRYVVRDETRQDLWVSSLTSFSHGPFRLRFVCEAWLRLDRLGGVADVAAGCWGCLVGRCCGQQLLAGEGAVMAIAADPALTMVSYAAGAGHRAGSPPMMRSRTRR